MVWKNKFHERINELWERAKDRNYKLTQAEYAQKLGVTRNALMGWLRGSGQPDADGFVRIATVENISLTWLMGDERPMKQERLLSEEFNFVEIFRKLTPEHREDLLVLAKQFQSHDICMHVAEQHSPYQCSSSNKNPDTNSAQQA